MAARKFELPHRSAWQHVVTGVIRQRRAGAPRTVEVGTDGVLVGERFIPYTDIRRVEHARQARAETRPTPGGEVETWHGWAVTLRLYVERKGGILLAGETIEIVTRRSQVASEDPLGAEMAQAIEEALAAWVDGQRDREVEVDVSRAGRPATEWLASLRRLGAGASDSYRSAAADVEKLSRLLDDPHEKPSARAAAAIVLAAAGDETAAARLRIAAAAMVDPRVRMALENVADDTAVAGALETLEEAERARVGRSAG